MKTLGFIISLIALTIIFIIKKKIDLTAIKYVVSIYIISIPFTLLSLLLLKKMGVIPNKHIIVSMYASLMVSLGYILFIFMLNFIYSKLIKFQVDIGNKNHTLIQTLIEYKLIIINSLSFVCLIMFSMGLYALWFDIKN